MKLYNIDTHIKAELMSKGLSIHHYVKKAYLAIKFLREINFDSAYYIKADTLTITDNKITLPDDFVGVVRIGIKNDQYVRELAPDMRLVDNSSVAEEETIYGYRYWYPNINKYGENRGGYYGYTRLEEFTYKVLREDNKILINNKIAADNDEVLLEYISDGLATGTPYGADDGILYVHPYALEAMNAFIDWQCMDNRERFAKKEARQYYYNQLRLYRARINPLTVKTIAMILRESYLATPKN